MLVILLDLFREGDSITSKIMSGAGGSDASYLLKRRRNNRHHVVHLRDAEQIGRSKKCSRSHRDRERHIENQSPSRAVGCGREDKPLRRQTNRRQDRTRQEHFA